jgi:uncharacterized protein (TIGR03435 family)
MEASRVTMTAFTSPRARHRQACPSRKGHDVRGGEIDPDLVVAFEPGFVDNRPLDKTGQHFGKHTASRQRIRSNRQLVRFAAVQTLGLKLDARKESVETIIVDHAAKIPTENKPASRL